MSSEETTDSLPPPPSHQERWRVRLAQLQALLLTCPSDLRSRYELATLLESKELYGEALVNWKAVIDHDANNLTAREGMARCRRQMECEPQPPYSDR